MRLYLTFAVLAALTFGMNSNAMAQTAANPNAPLGTQQLQKLTGLWVGDVSDQVTGSPALIVSGYQNCRWTADGWAIACKAAFTATGFDYNEAILGGYDATQNQVQWSVVNSFGQAYSMYGQFVNDNQMVLTRTTNSNGHAEVDTVTYTFDSQTKLRFVEQVTVDGSLVDQIEGTMTRVHP